MPDAMIETEQLTKSYEGKRGIVDASLRVEHGDVFGFLGPNGAGKMTTLRILMALLHADSGRARTSRCADRPTPRSRQQRATTSCR